MNDFWRLSLRPVYYFATFAFVFAIVIFVLGDLPAVAQIQFQPGQQLTPEQIEKFREMRGRRRGGRGPTPPPAEAKPEEKKPEKKEEEKKEGDEKKEEGTKTIKRPTDGSGKLDPNRIRLKPDKNGLVQFNYNTTPWAEVLQEFSDASKLSFDWMELPADGLNLVTQKKYSLTEARDLLNRHLLARGFTLLLKGEVLTAVKIEKIDPSLVPRVELDDLEDYPPHDFVRVRFKLPLTMEPAKAAEEVKLLLSPNAKVTPLLTTKRLLIIDSVANLRSVRDLLYAEQMASDSIITPQVYHIKHRRADYVADQIMIVLGLDPASRKTPQELQLETQRLQLMMQMQKQNKDVSKMLKKDGPPVHIATDRLQNTLLINAPPEIMPQIELTIKSCDVPTGAGMATDLGGRSTRPHKTKSGSTDAVVTALMDFGQLDPLTRLQSDANTRTIFAYATEADHKKIEQMISKLDESGREIHVIWLRKLPARNVAGTLTSLLVGNEDEKKNDRNSRRFGFSFYDMMRQQQKEDVGFKAMADVENNRLIIWANEEEFAEVKKMLAQLGETPDIDHSAPTKVRVLEARTPEETAELLERLKAAYPGKLNIQQPAAEPKAQEPKPTAEEDKVTRYVPSGQMRVPSGRAKFLTVQTEAPATTKQSATKQSATKQSTTKQSEPKPAEPEVNITVGKDGRIVITSDNPEALRQLEQVLQVVDPPRDEFDYFQLDHVYASGVVGKLEEYFEEELKGQTESVYDEWGQYEGRKEKDLGPATLGRGQLLRFMYEDYTNTVIVQGANASQIAVIRSLIKIYDQAPKPKDYYARKTEVIQLKYSRAQNVSASLKEVYRELLSSKDKEFQDKEGSQSVISSGSKTYVFGDVEKNESGEESPVLIKFDGMLAIGVDNVSNALIISARKEVLDSVKETVQLLDQAAIPDTKIHVHRVGGGIRSADKLQKLLKESMSRPWPGGRPEQAAAKPQGGNQGEQPSGERSRSESRSSSSRRGRR